MFTTAVDTASAHCSPFFLVLLFIITIQLFCWLSPPLGNKITDAGVLLYTPRQHQDVVPRRKQHSPFSPSLLFNRKKKGCEPSQRDGQMVFPYRIHPFCLLPNSSFRSFHQSRLPGNHVARQPSSISGQPGHPDCLQYSVSVQSTFYLTGLSSTYENVMEWQSWKPSHWHKMRACSALFHVLFSHWSNDECVLSEFPIIRYVDSFCIQMSDVWCSFSFDQTGRRPVAVFYYLL